MVERRRQVGRVARILSERRAQLPAGNVLGALALIGVVGDVFSKRRRVLVGQSAESGTLRTGAVGRVRGVRWVGFHWGHGGGERAGVGPGGTVEFIQSGLGAGKHAGLTLSHVRAEGGVGELVGGEAGWRGRRIGGGVVVRLALTRRASAEGFLVQVLPVS